jgi:predicted nucleotidyltransferase
MTLHGIEIPRERIEEFCRANGIRRLAFFGSILHDDVRPESDVDVLVEFQPGVRVGLAFIRMQDELSAILGHKVDLNTPGSLSKYFQDEILHEAEALYVAA